MAYQMNVTLQGGVVVNDAYIRVVRTEVKKGEGASSVLAFVWKTGTEETPISGARFETSFTYDLAGEDALAQGYVALGLLPDFAGAVEV